MFFYVDETGHTGTNLFDADQPSLYYGVLHSKTDLDVAAAPIVAAARARLGVPRLHAAELGVGRLIGLVPDLLTIHAQCGLCFDLYRVRKADHALVCFFDQVFDQGMNPAVPWTSYWTPLRYLLLMKVAALFDESLLRDAWAARIDTNTVSANARLVSVCEGLLQRISHLPDARSREIIGDTLKWAAKHPDAIHYNCPSKQEVLNIAPNIIGFQFVMLGIARRIDGPSGATRIIVDQQSQFNKAQRTLAEVYASIRRTSMSLGPGMPQLELANIPTTPIEFRAGQDSVGLELVDLYLWVFKRHFDRAKLARGLYPLIESQLEIGGFDQISLDGITARWQPFFENLPEPTEAQLAEGLKILELQEQRRKKAMEDPE